MEDASNTSFMSISSFTKDDLSFPDVGRDGIYYLKELSTMECYVCERIYVSGVLSLTHFNIHPFGDRYYYIPSEHQDCVEIWKLWPIPIE